jgi:hypothetical protein
VNRIEAAARAYGITRLCHFTPMRNFVHIAASGDGLRSLVALQAAERAAYDQQDRERLDGYPDHLCCSIEYPNAWYFQTRARNPRAADRLFRDWVVLGIAPHHLWAEGTLFCPRNAAARSGRLVTAGYQGFASLYAPEVVGARDIQRRRSATRFRACPTDDQAEVLVQRHIPLVDIDPVFVKDETAAKRIYVGLEQVGAPVEAMRFVIAPDFFNAGLLSVKLAAGERPEEREWDPRSLDANSR